MIKIKIITTGKVRETWLESAINEYQKRLKTAADVRFDIARDDKQLAEWIHKEPAAICLDAGGQLMDSQAFSAFFQKKLIEQGSRLCFAIGGAEGLPAQVKESHFLLSLSPMTFTHHMTRLILIEQLYRAFEIYKGSEYHK